MKIRFEMNEVLIAGLINGAILGHFSLVHGFFVIWSNLKKRVVEPSGKYRGKRFLIIAAGVPIAWSVLGIIAASIFYLLQPDRLSMSSSSLFLPNPAYTVGVVAIAGLINILAILFARHILPHILLQVWAGAIVLGLLLPGMLVALQ